jgi:hypothetical protein
MIYSMSSSAMAPDWNVKSHRRAASFDHLVGASEQRRGHVEAKRLGGLKIDREPVIRQRLYWQVGSAMSVQRSFVPRK